MEGSVLVDSETCGRGGNKTQKAKVLKGDFLGGPTKKMLTDITNLQQEHLKPSNQPAKKQSATLGVDESTGQLLKENTMLMKLLASRNAIIESSKAELQKLQSDFQKLSMQNVDLARANSQMLAELNSSRQRLRELQLELGCKNGILRAVKLESKTSKLKDEVTANESQQSGQTFKADGRADNLSNAKRIKVSKSQSSGAAIIKQSIAKEKVDKQRRCLRRQSVGFKPEEPGLTEDSLETDNTKSCVSHLKENLVKREGLASSGTTVREEAGVDTESAGPPSIVQPPLGNIENRRQSLRRQSARFRTEVSEPTEETREDTELSGFPTVEQVDTKENVDERIIRRQSARFKPEDPKPTEDLFEIDDPKFAVLLHDSLVKRSSPTTSCVDSGQQNKENNSVKFDPQEVRRSSVGRPLRQAVEKVRSYKEIPRNVKLRRAD
ncbi:SHUGOSHIN 2-like isoform X1 [Prosopis cineraria]|uniref:SHUGOSHIN 2-like isoform X1 n=2 Tax=Prosopis cineraria TaxID=364024 RepID=UPI00240EE246|nr:SHUGOSHIN 2-like isoform X1 [Prosopis cineraria]